MTELSPYQIRARKAVETRQRRAAERAAVVTPGRARALKAVETRRARAAERAATPDALEARVKRLEDGMARLRAALN